MSSHPYRVVLEPVEGCTLRCSYCGIHSIRTPDNTRTQMISEDLAVSVISQIHHLGWPITLALSGRGEPTLHPDLPGLIEKMRKAAWNVPIVLETAGTGLILRPDDIVEQTARLMNSGLNSMVLNVHPDDRRIARLLRWLHPLHVLTGHSAAERDDSGTHEQRESLRRSVASKFILVQDGYRPAEIHNEAGFSGPLESSSGKCWLPQIEMFVRFDGTVTLCKHDWAAECSPGSVMNAPLEDLWRHPLLEAARRRTYRGIRDFRPCLGCSRVETLRWRYVKHSSSTVVTSETEDILRAHSGRVGTSPRTYGELY